MHSCVNIFHGVMCVDCVVSLCVCVSLSLSLCVCVCVCVCMYTCICTFAQLHAVGKYLFEYDLDLNVHGCHSYSNVNFTQEENLKENNLRALHIKNQIEN